MEGNTFILHFAEKATAIGFSIIQDHPFVDGNKRTGHAVMEVFLIMNGYEIRASVDDTETVVLRVASSKMGREEFTAWIQTHLYCLEPI